MSSPEGRIQTPEGRIVLSQDIGQYEQSVQKARIERAQKEQKEQEAAEKEYEKDVAAAEAQYQKELSEYNKQQAEAQKQNKYDTEIARLESEKQLKLAKAHKSVWGVGGSRNRSELRTKEAAITKEYSILTGKVVEQKRLEKGYESFREAYPGVILPRNVAQTFRSSPSFSLVNLYQQKIEGKAAKAEYQRQASAQTAQAEGTKLSREYHGNIPNIGFISSGLGTERGDAVKPLPDAPTGKKAVETRQRLTNVDTGQSIMGGQQASPAITITRTETYRETPDGPVLVRNVERTIPEKKASKGVSTFANPLAFVASLDKQNVDAAGIPIKEKVKPQSNIEILKETVSRYQALTGEQKAPYKTVLEASLIDRERRIDPISKLFISQYALKEYKTQAEAYGLPEAKGKKGAIYDPRGAKLFDMETGMGDVNIGRKLGFVYDYNLQRPIEEKPVLFEGSLQYVLAPKVQGPQQPKFEEAVGAVGTIDYALKPEPKQTSFNKALEKRYNELGELQQAVKGDLVLQLDYARAELERMGIGAVGFVTSGFEQYIDPHTKKIFGIKSPDVAPIDFKVPTSETTQITALFDVDQKLSPIQNIKKYIGTQSKFVSSQGIVPYAVGGTVNYFQLVTGIGQAKLLLETSVRSAPKILSIVAKPALPRLGSMAREAALLGSTGKISSPSRMWDVAEPVQKVGLRIEKKVQPTWAVQKQQLPVPNPFGKERIIPYYLRQGITKVTDFGKKVIIKPRGFTTPIFLKNFGDISLNPAHLGTKPNIPTRMELEKPPEYKRTYPTLGIMRGIFYPDIPAPRSKAPLIPSGFTKINPRTITARESARQIIKLPSLFKNKLSLPKLSSPQFIKKSQQQWQGFVFMQKKRIGAFKETLPTFPSLPKPKANQFVTIQRKIRDVKSSILETKRLSLQLFEWPTAKKQVVPAFGKQELKNLTREDTNVPVIVKKKLRPLDELLPDHTGKIKITKIDLESLQKQINILEADKSFTFRTPIAYDIKTQKPSLTIIDEDYLKTERGISIRIEGVDLLTGEKTGIGGVRFGTPDDLLQFLYKEQKRLTPSTSPTKSPPFMEGFGLQFKTPLSRLEEFTVKKIGFEAPVRGRGRAPLEISRFADVSGLGSVTQRPQSFFEMRRRFPSAPVEFGIIPKGTGMDALKETLTFYHSTSKEGAKRIRVEGLKDISGQGIYLSDKKEYAKSVAFANDEVLEFETQKNLKILDMKKIHKDSIDPISDEYRDFVKKGGLDNIIDFAKYKKYDLVKHGLSNEYMLVNPNILKLKPPVSKITRITSERYRQMPKMDPSWPKPPPPVQGDEFMNQLTALRRKMKGETSMLFSDPKRTSKVNVRLIKNEMEGLGYFKTATPFQLKQPKLADWPANWKQLAKTESPDVADYLSQKRSFRRFGKTEEERMFKGVGGAGASSYPDVPFGRFGKQKGVPTNLFTLERATPPVSFPVKRETGMFRLLNISAEEQTKLDIATKQTINKIMKERKRGELPDITTRSQDTSKTLTGKAKLSFVSEPLRTSPIVFQRQRGLFDTRLSIRKGSLIRGLKPIRDARDYLPDKFAETRIVPKGGKPLDLSSWKPKLEIPETKESNFFFKRERFGKNVIRDDMALPSIRPALIIDKQTFKKITIQYRKGKTDVFFRKFEKSPINSPTKDLSKRTNWDKLASESKKTKEQKDRAWEESQRAPKGGAGQILEPPGPRNVLNLPEPEMPAPEAIADVGAKIPFKKDKYKIPLIIPPTPKETKKEKPVQTAQVYQEILLSDNRPKLSTVQSPRISLAVSQPQKIQESFKISNIQTPRIKIAEMTATKPRQREKQRPRQISTPRYETLTLVRVTPKLAQKQTPKLSSPLAPKAPTRLSAPQRQPLREKPRQITLLRTPPRRPPKVIFALPPDKDPEKKKEKKKEKEVIGFYLGNVPETQISGMFRRREIITGKERITKTRSGDVRVLLGKKRETRRKKKDEYVLGFKAPKTKFF